MKQLWVDTETTGLDPAVSGAFEIAFLVFDKGIFKEEKLYHLNPLTDTVLFSKEAYKVNGVSEETIRSYPPAETVIPEIVDWFAPYIFPKVNDKTEPEPEDKFVFAGYYASFDFGHIKALFDRQKIDIDYFFDGRIIDVLEYVKKAKAKKIIGYTENNKLETITEALGIPHNSAHTAKSDIWAARKLYETIRMMERKAK